MVNLELLQAEAARHPYSLLFATISGAHLYGFPSPDSDYDLRGVHVLPMREVLGILPKKETIEFSEVCSGIEIDLVTHDVLKFFTMLLRRNGYVLEQLYSPLIVKSTPEHAELREIALGCITRHHSHHYLGFAQNQWELFQKEEPPQVKPLLNVYRVILTGIHLMQAGEVEANLVTLNEKFRLPYIPQLVERKVRGPEKGKLDGAERTFHTSEYKRLLARLEESSAASRLPQESTAREASNDLLVRVRLRA